MRSNEYRFLTHWRVESTREEVSRILGAGTDLPRWWPAVYLDVREMAHGDESGVGRVHDLYTKGWLPYTLRWQARGTESRYPEGFSLEATGDFVGRGIWTFRQDGQYVDVTYDWRPRAEKPLLRYGSFLMKPVFAANHRWAMARGEESLKLELARRHAVSDAERAAVAAPPGPTKVGAGAAVLAAAVGVAALGALALVMRQRTERESDIPGGAE